MTPSPPVDHPFAAYLANGAADFRPDWDVPSFGRPASDALMAELDAVRANPAPNGRRRIHALLGPSGYGKTHLFGRVLHARGDAVHFAYVPMTSDPARVSPAEQVRWGVLDSLFRSSATFAPLRRHLARLFAPSFAAYLDALPAGLRGKCAEVRKELDADPLMAVVTVLGPAEGLPPYHHLADDVRRRHPELSAGAVRALVLSLSPAADDAWAWLRGEDGSLTDARRRDLLLTDDPPDVLAVLKAVAVLLRQVRTPLLVCLDQTEELLKKDAVAFHGLTSALMAWLQEVPNLVLVLGCIRQEWGQMATRQGYEAFVHRVEKHDLTQFTPAEAADFLARRVRSWQDRPAGAPDGWPFDLDEVRAHAARSPSPPRGFLLHCRERFDDWRAKGEHGLVRLSDTIVPPPDDFPQLWQATLDQVAKDARPAAQLQLDQLWAGVKEVLDIARLAKMPGDGVAVERVTPFEMKKDKTAPAAQVELVVGTERFPVVVTVSKPIENGQGFNSYFDGWDAATKAGVVGTVAVWSIAKPFNGKTSKGWDKYRERVSDGKIRPFPLDEHTSAFQHMEAVRRLLDAARAGNVIAAGKPLTADDCRRRLADSGMLVNLKLFELLFGNWPVIEAVRAKSTVSTQVPVAISPIAPPTRSALIATTPTIRVVSAPSSSAVSVVAQSPVAAAAPKAITPPVPVAAPRPAQAPIPPGPPQPETNAWAAGMLDQLVSKLRAKGQPVRPAGYDLGPTFARFKVEPKDDADYAKVRKQADNLKLHLGLTTKPIIAAQAGYISIDVQRPDRQTVPLAPLLATRPAALAGRPAFPLGTDVTGTAHWLDLADSSTCHLLLAGTTGSGKSELLKVMLAALADHLGPDELQVFLIDPKRVTFNLPGESPYVPKPVVYDAAAAIPVVEECFEEMERRYDVMQQRGVENIGELTGTDAVPRWVVVFDEFADLMADKVGKKELERFLPRLGAKARAAGIHLVLGTQRPEATVVTPLLRSNLPGRLSLWVMSERDSKIILDEPDAAHLLGKGDLFWRAGGGLVRLQSPFVTKPELERALRYH